MKLNTKNLTTSLNKILEKLKKNSLFIGIVLVLLVFLFVIWQIRYYSLVEPTSSEVDSKVNELQTPRLDQSAVKKILDLQDQNVEVKALFNDARQNPFQE